ncbi:SANT/Myb_domain [Hexamita inflata]|uniref:SANT/Myb domain n=1 Tax=Hexamita inflata TaxID=28002 RepID=A0AA86PG40_9EUKA|nr:SANT/Myb domain [Hexamita inflata]
MARILTRWTEEETTLMNKLVEQYNNNFKLVASAFPCRTYNQVKSHYFNELHKNQNKSEVKSKQNKNTVKKQRHLVETQSIDQEITAEKSTLQNNENLDQDISFYVFQELLE